MKRSRTRRIVAPGLLAAALAGLSAITPGPARGGDILWDILPLFNTRPSLSSKVIVSDACFRTCTAECSSQFHVCAHRDVLNGCRAGDDACELSCQKTCRTYGGPLLSVTNSD